LGYAPRMALNDFEESQLRSLLDAERARRRAADEKPWESGVIDHRPAPGREEVLGKRVDELELAFKTLCELLVERRILAPDAIAARLAEVAAQRAEQEAAAQQAKRQAEDAKRRRTVECAICHAVVPERSSYVSARGTICGKCHVEIDGE